MSYLFFTNPKRFPKNAEGPFYTTGHLIPCLQDDQSQLDWIGDCLTCMAPEAEVPDLLASINNQNSDTYFVRQPSTEDEIARAGMAAKACCTSTLRYGGQDPLIFRKLDNSPEYCDYVLDSEGNLLAALDQNGDLLPFAAKIVAEINGWAQ